MTQQYIPSQYIFNLNTISPDITILGRNKKAANKELQTTLISADYNKTVNIAIELHLSSQTDKLISDLFNYYLSDINIYHLCFINYFYKFYLEYNKIDTSVKKSQHLVLVNSQFIRNFITFIVPTLSLARKGKIDKLPKITEADFNLTNIKHELLTQNLNNVNRFIQSHECRDIVIPLSEICNYFESSLLNKTQKIIYWYSWLIEYERVYHKGNLLVEYRENLYCDVRFKKDFIWIIWNMLLHYSPIDTKPYIAKLYYLFSQNYNKSHKKSRANIIILAIYIITNFSSCCQYLDDKILINGYQISLKCNLLYKQVYNQYNINSIKHYQNL